MPFSAEYKKIIESEKSVSKSLVLPRNIYKITSYEYVDGKVKPLVGPETAIIFIFGIFDKKFIGLKISEIKPDEFFKWMKKMFHPTITEEQLESATKLHELLITADKKGQRIYEGFVKNKRIGRTNKNIYRTYNISGVKQIMEVSIDKNFLKNYINLVK